MKRSGSNEPKLAMKRSGSNEPQRVDDLHVRSFRSRVGELGEGLTSR